ncbi:MAG: hypothetical protein IKP00_09560 [Victivallales bacterium]|nr:hypothetical protein [Victivallales bacterium]
MKKNTKHKCPCCGKLTIEVIGDYEICEVCGWEDDPVQRKDKDFAGGANELSLNQARREWKARQTADSQKK